jgi:uncharacterized protein (UPF0371 family)
MTLTTRFLSFPTKLLHVKFEILTIEKKQSISRTKIRDRTQIKYEMNELNLIDNARNYELSSPDCRVTGRFAVTAHQFVFNVDVAAENQSGHYGENLSK